MSNNDEKLSLYLSYYNREAQIEYNSNIYKFTESDFESINSIGNYWHHQQDPSSWLCTSMVSLGKRKFSGTLPRHLVIDLCAQTLNITAEKLESTLNWNANYMAWHDGGNPSENHIWEKD